MIIVTLGAELAGGAEIGLLANHDHLVVEWPGDEEVDGGPVSVRHERWKDGRQVAAGERSWDRADRMVVASWLRSAVSDSAGSAVCVVGPERDLDFASAILTTLAGDHCLVFEKAVYRAEVLRIENGAYACAVTAEAAAAEWNRQHPFRADVVDPTDAEALVAFIDGDHLSSPSEPPRDGDVLLVSYFGPPSTPVSTRRLGYWHDEIERLSGQTGRQLTPWWLSATRRSQGRDRCLFIPDPGDDAFDPEAPTPMNQLRNLRLSEVGGAWELAVRETVRQWPGRFETVVISVGPFGYLALAEFFSQFWGAQVVLDFRDPLAGENRRPFSSEQRAWLAEYERECVRHADAVISVNRTCLERIAPDVTVDRHSVANGFDERIEVAASTPSDRSVHRIVYSGTIFANLPLDRVIDAMDPSQFELVHYGRDNTGDGLVGSRRGTVAGGFLTDAAELSRAIAGADLGLVRVSGEPTTQTTKVFDYLGAGIEVLIVTDGAVRSGGLHELTDGTPGVHWVRNEVEEIAAFLAEYRPNRPGRADVEHLTREAQTTRLVEVIQRRRLPELRRPAPAATPMPIVPTSVADAQLVALQNRVEALEAGLAAATTDVRGLNRRTDLLRFDRQLQVAARRVMGLIRRAAGLVWSRLPKRATNGHQRQLASPGTKRGFGLSYSRSALPTVLVVSPAYPVGSGTYGGQPVARRVRNYQESGYASVVFVPTNVPEVRDVIDDDGTRIIVAPAPEFAALAEQVRPDVLAVHSPLPETWSTLEPWTTRVPTVAWFHGYEARDWRLLSFDYSEAEIEQNGSRLDAVMVDRRRLLEGVFANEMVAKVFVSDYMRQIAEAFVGVPSRNGQVIHNVIDTDLFAYRERLPEERFRISSVRSFAKRNYGTDLIAPVVRELQHHPRFDDLEVTVMGTGRFFAEDVALLAGLPNVTVAEQVLPAVELSAHLDRHGVVLLPTRWDSQGMLMGEAMATGAVPVTNGVTAIPEFADDSVGVLAPGEDAEAMAAGVIEMLEDADLFMDRSKAARARVVEQCGPEATTRREIELFDRLRA